MIFSHLAFLLKTGKHYSKCSPGSLKRPEFQQNFQVRTIFACRALWANQKKAQIGLDLDLHGNLQGPCGAIRRWVRKQLAGTAPQADSWSYPRSRPLPQTEVGSAFHSFTVWNTNWLQRGDELRALGRTYLYCFPVWSTSEIENHLNSVSRSE